MAELQPSDRPRERLLDRGAEALSERELLALVLRDGHSSGSALDLASSLLTEFGGLHGVSVALPEELSKHRGVGPAKTSAVVAAFRLGRLAVAMSPVSAPLKSAADVGAAARPYLDGARRERLVVLVCDAANRLIRVERITEGSVDRAMVPVREVLNAVLRHDGRSFALAHNHPSGDPMPSDPDREATAAIKAGAEAVGLRFLDHVVIAGSAWCSVTGRRSMPG